MLEVAETQAAVSAQCYDLLSTCDTIDTDFNTVDSKVVGRRTWGSSPCHLQHTQTIQIRPLGAYIDQTLTSAPVTMV